MSLVTYKDARPWAKAIKAAVTMRKMPPWFADQKYGHFTNDRSLKQNEIDILAKWVDGGAAEGNPKDAPPPVEWPVDGWAIRPEVVVELPPHDVPAKGILEWELIALPSPFKSDTWVTSMEILPGDPSVVHHICFSFEKHLPATVYNRYEWVQVPRDETGNPTPGNSGSLADVETQSAEHLWSVGTALGKTLVLEAPSRFEGTVTGDTGVAGATVSPLFHDQFARMRRRSGLAAWGRYSAPRTRGCTGPWP